MKDEETSVQEVFDSILAAVGATPIVQLRRFGGDLPCDLLAKCEFLNPSGSAQDRSVIAMVEAAEADGRIQPGDTLIDASSGSTGVALAACGAAKGYRVIVAVPEDASREKQTLIQALGAELIRTPAGLPSTHPKSHMSVAARLEGVISRSCFLNQQSNPAAVHAHREGTAVEILKQTGGMLDVVVVGAGTGATLTGIAQGLKRQIPNLQVVGVDPVGSILAGGAETRPYLLEGLGNDTVPEVLDRSVVDRWIKVDDRHAFQTARRLLREEGLLCGGSSGAVAWAAREVARSTPSGARVLMVLVDGVRNYLSGFADDEWMLAHRFSAPNLGLGSVGDLLRKLPPRPLITGSIDEPIAAAVDIMKAEGISQLPVLDQGILVGLVTEHDILQALVVGSSAVDRSMAEVMNRQISTVAPEDPIQTLIDAFSREEVGLVTDAAGRLLGILAKIDLVDYIAQR